MQHHYILYDRGGRNRFLPLAYTRALAGLRTGILTFRERWEKRLGQSVAVQTAPYLQPLYPLPPLPPEVERVWVDAAVLPCENLVQAIKALRPGQKLLDADGMVLALNWGADGISKASPPARWGGDAAGFESLAFGGTVKVLGRWQDLFLFNDLALRSDFELLTAGKTTQPVSGTNAVTAPENVFLEEGARMEHCTLNASDGPVYLGKKAEMMEGCLVRGGLALCDNATLKMGAKIYGATTVGPHCKVGGEVGNSVFLGYANKAHDGYLGNSVIGEWCNLGADTNNSNLKNNYSTIKCHDYETGRERDTGLQFCGMAMGDHSKSGINTMFNTGTVVGVAANIFGGGFPPKYIPSFSWGGAGGFATHQFDKAVATARAVYARRNHTLTDAELGVLRHLYENREA